MTKDKRVPATESIFDDRTACPDEAALREGLLERITLWQELTDLPAQSLSGATAEWSFYTKKTGWILLLKRGKKTICTCIPAQDALIVIFLLPDRAVTRALDAPLPEELKTTITAAKSYKMGRPFRVYVKTQADLNPVQQLIDIKAASWRN